MNDIATYQRNKMMIMLQIHMEKLKDARDAFDIEAQMYVLKTIVERSLDIVHVENKKGI